MPGQYADFVRQATTGTGTGTLTLGAVVTGFRTLATAGYVNLEKLPYTIFAVDAGGNPSGEWEVGVGVYVSATPALQRTRALASSNSNALVNFSAGTKHVIVGIAADVLPRAWGITGCRLSLDTNWCPTADITTSGTLRLLPGPAGGQVCIPMQPGSEVFGPANAGASGVSLALPTAEAANAGITCGITNGSVAVTHGVTTAVPTGCLVIGTGIPTGTYVLASTTTGFTMSRPATATNASASLTFYYSIYDVYATMADYTTHNRSASTGMQVPTLSLAKWTNNTTPSVKTGGATAQGHPLSAVAVNGVYIGTIQYFTTTASRDTAAHRALYNQFNQLPRRLHTNGATTGSYAYTTGAWRIANGDYTNQVEFVVGGGAASMHHGNGIMAASRQVANNSAAGIAGMGILVDLDSGPANSSAVVVGGATGAYNNVTGTVVKTDHPGIGYHRWAIGEFGAASTNFVGTDFGGNSLTGTILG